jgi:hypothetical protein
VLFSLFPFAVLSVATITATRVVAFLERFVVGVFPYFIGFRPRIRGDVVRRLFWHRRASRLGAPPLVWWAHHRKQVRPPLFPG